MIGRRWFPGFILIRVEWCILGRVPNMFLIDLAHRALDLAII